MPASIPPPSDAAESSAAGPTDTAPASESVAPPRHLATLTSLRFFAAVAILVMHYFRVNEFDSAHVGRPVRDLLVTYVPALRHGRLAVDFFFVLSGFVLAHVYLDAFRGGRFHYVRFVRKRLARLYPLHLFTLAVTLIGLFGLWTLGRLDSHLANNPGQFRPGALLTNLLMVHAWGFERTVTFNAPSWSISAEWFAYLCFPAVLWSLTRLRPAAATVLAFGWFGLIDGLCRFGPFWPSGADLTRMTAPWGVLRIIAEFPLGVALFMLSRTVAMKSDRAGVTGRSLFFGGLLVTWAVCHNGWPSCFAVVALAGSIFGAAVTERAGGLRWLIHPALVYGGEISYSIYMMHMCLRVPTAIGLSAAGFPPRSFGHDVGMLVAIPIVIFASHLTYQFIERPGQALLTGRTPAWPVFSPTRAVAAVPAPTPQ